jgi:UDP-2,3-diacylglucosamine pyrophosphatase LpxH
MKHKRIVDLVVLSDLHLGTFGCHAKELLEYLKSVKPRLLILNGDIIDMWNFRKRYFPKSHLKVLKRIITLAQQGTEVVYITGNHDEMLRRFADMDLGLLKLRNAYSAELGGERVWFFHGDVFDASIQNAKWLAKLGGWSYDALIWLNRWINLFLEKMGREKFSLSKKVKDSVKKAVSFVQDFEVAAAEWALARDYHRVVCGHIHQPQIRTIETKNGSILYMNSGDWVENCTALEYHNKSWSLYTHAHIESASDETDDKVDAHPSELVRLILGTDLSGKVEFAKSAKPAKPAKPAKVNVGEQPQSA